MSLIRCRVCDQIKDSTQFANREVCTYCFGKAKVKKKREKLYLCYFCKKKVSIIDESGFCESCSTDYWGHNRTIKADKRTDGEIKITSDSSKRKERSLSTKQVSNRVIKLKKDMVKLIFELMNDEIDINEIPGFEEINLQDVTKENLLKNYSIEELAILLSVLEYNLRNCD
ncbi:hypothetical protein V7124_04230 [Neobacillus niacini]|uniref:hypothetical protein n=1 Tax=Neobacillus niacini TaxID=86668 RepID=UPI002FFFC5A0